LCTLPEWRWFRAKILSILIYNQQLQNEATSHLIFCVAGIFCRKIVDHISNFVSPFLLQTRRTRIRHGGLDSKESQRYWTLDVLMFFDILTYFYQNWDSLNNMDESQPRFINQDQELTIFSRQ
jgi:hypothetical protein